MKRNKRWVKNSNPHRQGQQRHQIGGRPLNPASQGPPRQRDQNFALLVKTLFGILQCLHHASNQRSQREGHSGSRAFSSKIDELNRFVKPASTNPIVQQAIKNINNRWASEICKALALHYRDTLLKLKETVVRMLLEHNLDLNRAEQIALSWAHRNYKKKLDRSTVDQFKAMTFDTVNIDQATGIRPATPPASQGSARPHGNRHSTARIDKPSQPRPRPAMYASHPPKAPARRTYAETAASPGRKSATSSLAVDNVDPSLAKSNSGKKGNQAPCPLAANLAKPAPTRVSDGTNYVQKVTVKNSDTKVDAKKSNTVQHSPHKGPEKTTEASKPMVKASVWRAPKVQYKNRDWVLPDIPDSAKTVVIGTSNISRITEQPTDSSLALFSFPGAKCSNLAALFKKAKVHDHVDRAVISVGINDRTSDPNKTVLPALRQVVAAARKIFPQAAVFYVLPQCSQSLPKKEVNNIVALSQLAIGDKIISGSVHLIQHMPTEHFRTDTDQVHWTEATANLMLRHWIYRSSKFVSPPKN